MKKPETIYLMHKPTGRIEPDHLWEWSALHTNNAFEYGIDFVEVVKDAEGNWVEVSLDESEVEPTKDEAEIFEMAVCGFSKDQSHFLKKILNRLNELEGAKNVNAN